MQVAWRVRCELYKQRTIETIDRVNDVVWAHLVEEEVTQGVGRHRLA